ncbi:MAG: hypothetical protein U9N14_03685, partial [Pseudomonadota bacterium]|nr:hypothetical protein [Pseudomonadota bacterium]
LDPSLLRQEREALDDIAVILVDRSPSQTFADRPASTDAALEHVRSVLESRPGLELRVVETDRGNVESTRLFDKLETVVSDVPRTRMAGVVLITDGQVHDVPERAAQLGDVGPVHALLTGARDAKDRKLTVVSVPRYGIVGQSVTIVIKAEDRPGKKTNRIPVTMRPETGAPITHSLSSGQAGTFEIDILHTGRNVIEFSVPALAGEITDADNRAAIIISGVRDRLKVLLISGQPHAGERTWRNLLKSDPAIDLVHFTILRPPEKYDGIPETEVSLIPFPVHELFQQKIDDFDLIIFDCYRKRQILRSIYLQNIANYVRTGGALIQAGGAEFAGHESLFRSPIGPIFPGMPTGRILAGPFLPRVTDMGRRHPVTSGLPGDVPGSDPNWGPWLQQVDIESESGHTLMTGAEDAPLLLLDHVGSGRIAQLATDQIWLWSRGFESGGPQAELLRRIAHWAMKEPDLEETDLRADASGGVLRIRRRTLEPEEAIVTVIAPSGKRTDITLVPEDDDPWTVADLPADELGVWRANDGDLTAVAVVGAANPPELADVLATESHLAPLVKKTGGGIVWLARDPLPAIRDVAPGKRASGYGWIGLRRGGAFRVTGVTQTPLLPAGFWLVLLAGTLIFAWYREGK